MPKEIPKAYEPNIYEDAIYKRWEDSGFFNPDNLNLPADAEAYTVILPPPNITDKLHLGHSSMLAIEDLLVRYHRMKGYRTLWLPGTDHAAIATQNVVEKKLLREEGKSRHDLGREKFLEKVWEFLSVTQHTILHQTRKMGASLDWSRQAFTLDEPREKAVRQLFVDMFKEGVIYRGERIVNWCPRCKSTLADDEMEYKEQKAVLYTFRYSADFPFAIATTRPETKLGDTAVAVNPKDERYKEYVGKTYGIDFVSQPLRLKIIADRMVEMDFGTGTLGVTPAHSMIDWKMAENNDLPIIKVIDENGNIHDGFGEYSGLSALEARERIVARLREQGLMEKEEEIENSLSVCYRCDTPIEPLPSKQWFLDVDKKLDRLDGKSLKEKAIEAAASGDIRFIPDRFTKRYTDWMENLHDWCISRQIWFGHRIPVWYRKGKGGREKEQGEGFVADSAEIYCGIKAPEGEGWIQDEDTLDTWFSSGMWTFSTLGWSDNFKDGQKTGDLARFHPTQVLETGYEIITLWVSRMVIMSFFALGEIPFENVYLHGMVQDKFGKKMSKSKGNGIDPLGVIEKHGTDAVRLSLLIGSTPGNDMRLGEDKIDGFRNFVNKLWNISRYIIMSYDLKISDSRPDREKFTEFDKWIVSKMESLISGVTMDLDCYRFSAAGEKLYSFAWDDLADWYLEACKFEKNMGKAEILSYLLSNLLKLLHPFIPFVTEAIWEMLGGGMLMVERWPSFAKASEGKPSSIEASEGVAESVKEIVIAIRNARSENRIEPARKVKAVIYAGEKADSLRPQEILIRSLRTGIEELEIMESGEKIEKAIFTIASGVEIYLLGAVDEEKEKARLLKRKEELSRLIQNLETKLSNQEFLEKAPAVLVEKEKEKLDGYRLEMGEL